MARAVVFLCAAAWIVCMVLSALALQAPATGDGFLRGFNRIEGFMLWQLVGLAVAVAGASMLRLLVEAPTRPLLVAGYGPVAVSGLLLLALIGIVAWAAFAPPPPAVPVDPMPPTAPAS